MIKESCQKAAGISKILFALPGYKLSERLKNRPEKLQQGENMASRVEHGSDAETKSEETLLGFAEGDWRPGMTYGRKEEKWLQADASELWIEEAGDWADADTEYLVKYREGRLGPSDRLEYGEFDDLEEAVEYAEMIVEGGVEVEDLKI